MQDENPSRQSEQDDRNHPHPPDSESGTREDRATSGGSEEMRGAGESDEDTDDDGASRPEPTE